jgi:hypothetical protein
VTLKAKPETLYPNEDAFATVQRLRSVQVDTQNVEEDIVDLYKGVDSMDA